VDSIIFDVKTWMRVSEKIAAAIFFIPDSHDTSKAACQYIVLYEAQYS
jgi:hypothetical protein